MKKYSVRKFYFILVIFFIHLIVYTNLNILGLNTIYVVVSFVCIVAIYILNSLYNLYRVKILIKKIYKDSNDISNKFLVFELVKKSDRYEEELVYELMKKISYDMYKENKELEYKMKSQADFFDLWIHEIKQDIQYLESSIEDFEALESVENISNNIETALYYSKVDQISGNIKFNSYDMYSLIKNSLNKLQVNIFTNNIKIDIKRKSHNIITDGYWLSFIIKQVISNSIKYNASVIRITYDEKYIEIVDNGIGIENSELKYICEKAYSGSNKQVSSTGMGLYYVEYISKFLNIDIKLKSQKNEYFKVILKIK